MSNLRRLGRGIRVSVPRDKDGFTGRECPACEKLFKIELGTGLKGVGLPCHCPYCGHAAGHDQFWTKDQVKYVKSIATRKITDAVRKDLKRLEFNHKPRGRFGIGLSLKVKPGRRPPIRYYVEPRLETEMVCDKCTLRYAVYGVFAFCPDCGQHNSLQILDRNLEIVGKMLEMASDQEDPLVAERFCENALEDCVSAFDGFGRELCRVHASKARSPARAEKLSFQSLESANRMFRDLFDLDLAAVVEPEEWGAATTAFQKRHLVAHKLGVVDETYIAKTGGAATAVGRKIVVDAGDVARLASVIGKLAERMAVTLEGETKESLTRDGKGTTLPHGQPDAGRDG